MAFVSSKTELAAIAARVVLVVLRAIMYIHIPFSVYWKGRCIWGDYIGYVTINKSGHSATGKIAVIREGLFFF